jgi:DNA polymerase-3 subunit gamma/tau
MTYQVLARKWRPQTFAEMVGQEHVTTTLANALAKGRVAHAYLFTGPRGCGKTTMARLLAKALNCDDGPTAEPCGRCPSCVAIAAGTFLDVLEIDAASNTGVDNIRELRENAQYQPTAGKRRVFIIDEVHMLSKGAFNALLKTLEEPPPHVHFVFATTEPVRIPRTILSRCQRFDFRLFRLDELVQRIRTIAESETISITPEAIELLASMAEGSMRDALSLFDQAVSASDGEVDQNRVLELYGLVPHDRYLALNEAILARDTRAGLDLVDDLASAGHDLVEFARGLVGNFRDLLLLRLDESLASRVEKPEAVRRTMADQARRFEVQDLLELTRRSADHYVALERAPRPRWLLEAHVVEYTRFESQMLLSEVFGRLEALRGGGAVDSTPSSGGSRSEAGGSAVRSRSTSRRAAGGGSAGSRGAPRAPAANVAATPRAELPLSETRQADLAHPELRDAYARLLTRAREQNMPVGTCLMEAVPRVEGGQLRLVFRREHAFHRDQVAQREVVTWLTHLATECFGRPLEVIPVSEDVAGSEETVRRQVQEQVAPSLQQELDRRARENPDLGRLIDGLGGQIIDGR